MNQTDCYLVHNHNKNCHYDHIPFNLKGVVNLFFWVHKGLNNMQFRAGTVNLKKCWINLRLSLSSKNKSWNLCLRVFYITDAFHWVFWLIWTERISVWFQVNRKSIITPQQFYFNWILFRDRFVCVYNFISSSFFWMKFVLIFLTIIAGWVV